MLVMHGQPARCRQQFHQQQQQQQEAATQSKVQPFYTGKLGVAT